MGRRRSDRSNWAAILAGGNGARLLEFTRLVAGDDRPKQFCRILGGRSLLQETRLRLCLNVEPAHTVYVVTKHHEPFYRHELASVRRPQIIAQPQNRGTANAIAYALIRLRELSRDAAVGFFPADHYYRDRMQLQRTVAAAYRAAHADPERVVLLGAEADRPETDYGWIEPGAPVDAWQSEVAAGQPVRTVHRFHEKPAAQTAADLLAHRCLWNTFVLIGKLGAFERLIAEALPGIWDAFQALRKAKTDVEEMLMARATYDAIPQTDFSQTVLTHHPDRLAVIRLAASGWTDLGQPSRVLDVLAHKPADSSLDQRLAAS